ncbi:FecR family protein [Solitalea canadensis]|uniref:Fe2+-dicitrate sensor, membrane component n=1 Tax=Solitalea canadensis (strain ATCC 29591 / DSM 3403 / JCM 21819 / LMG 8368 / NBRC 15130 / NCIMB 12057 / USAM 9D) TaxID=929556 RepID=H8KT72_SOLCM|nr:FecR family protein [Solitalea canadensis]AFD05255.1 Fe2+-dicitrate sensor, membrane component [Solitalea canadensis DSM 3403]
MKSGNNEEKIVRSFYHPEIEFEVKNELYLELSQTVSTDEDRRATEPLFEKICTKIAVDEKLHRRTKIIRMVKYIGTRAAILVAGMLIYVLAIQPNLKKEVAEFKFIAPGKSITQTILPDGSSIFLNANSELTYKLDPSNKLREVFLKGEGWFKVAKMPHTPFIVHTSKYSVAVHGTTFNVKAYPGSKNVVTTLQEGSIEIIPNEGVNIKPVMLTPGEQFSYNTVSAKSTLLRVDSEVASVWKESEIRFENKKFSELLSILESRYNVQFIVKDSSLLNYHYDGSIRNENIIQVLNLIKETLPIKYQLVNNNIILIEKQ